MFFTLERFILIIVWVVSITALFLVPNRCKREAHAIFLFQQFLTWILGLIVVQNGWIDYPIREFRQNATSFTFEFLAYPTVAAYLNIFYPGKKKSWIQFVYMTAYPAGITVTELCIEKSTQLIDYISWNWYWTFLSTWATLYLSRGFHVWFFRKSTR
ncbi:CBO0543 family protein [Paenibacillus sp. SI8]|uniref:CBO0543 family protein n=1 Tax=unclassified Paenibacillus TaxID=185978 RepID=UPI0034673ABC